MMTRNKVSPVLCGMDCINWVTYVKLNVVYRLLNDM